MLARASNSRSLRLSDGLTPRFGRLGVMEEILPPLTLEGAGFERTRIRQFTVFLENRVGRLQALVAALEDVAAVVALSIEESADCALVRLICTDADAARQTLQTEAFCFSESEVLAVALAGQTRKPMTTLCTTLLAAEINIHYAYPLLLRPERTGLILYVEDPTLAARLLIKKGFMLIGESDLGTGP